MGDGGLLFVLTGFNVEGMNCNIKRSVRYRTLKGISYRILVVYLIGSLIPRGWLLFCISFPDSIIINHSLIIMQ